MAKQKTTGSAPEQQVQGAAPVSPERTAEELAAENAELQQINTELQNRLEAEAGKKATTVPTVEHDGRRFEVTAPTFNLKGQILTAETLQEKPEVVAELVKMGSGILKEIV